MTKRERAYLLPDTLCPAERLDICISIPNNLGHIMPFLAQIERLANWYAWETNETRDNEIVAACWRNVFNAVRNSIDNQLGCGAVVGIQDVRMVDCVIEKQMPDDSWELVGSVADCVEVGIASAIADGTLQNSSDVIYAEPVTNATNPTMADVACGIADFMSEYLIEKFNDQLDLMEAAITAGVSIAKITADVVDAVAGWAPIVGGIIAAVKDVIEGSVALTFAVVRASDTVDWRSEVKCALLTRLRDNNGTIGADRTVVIDGWIADIKAMAEAISPLFGRFLDGLDYKAYRKWQKIAENNEGECDDCVYRWHHDFDFTTGAHGWTAFDGRGTLSSEGWNALATGDTLTNRLYVILNIPEGAQLDGEVSTVTISNLYQNDNDVVRGKDGEDWTGTQVFSYSGGLPNHFSIAHGEIGGDFVSTGVTKSVLFAMFGYEGSTLTLHKIRLYGTGAEPTWL